MFASTTLLATVILALTTRSMANPVARESIVTLPLRKHFKAPNANGKRFVSGASSTRYASALPHSKAYDESIDHGLWAYTATVGVGNPPQPHDLLVDTGSSNTWVNATTPYVVSNTSIQTEDGFALRYGSGAVTGWEYLDQISLGDDFVLHNQSIGVANSSAGFTAFDGILGLGRTGLTNGTLWPSTTATIPTVIDNAYEQGLISSKVLGLYFEPSTEQEVENWGEVTFGGFDKAKIVGDLTYAPLTQAYPANARWGVDLGLTYGKHHTPIMNTTAGIIDCGTTFIYIAADAYARYIEATGAVMDPNLGLLTVNSTESLQSLFFNIQGVPFELTPDAQIWPRELNSMLGGDPSVYYIPIFSFGVETGSGWDFVVGYTFLERHYTVYDYENNQVGFGRTRFTDAIINSS